MRQGKDSAHAWSAVDGMFTALQGFDPASPREVGVLRRLRAAAERRAQRPAEPSRRRRRRPALGDRALILVGSLVIIGYAVLVGSTSYWFHAIGAGSIALVVGLSLVVLVDLIYPFSGDLSVGSAAFTSGTSPHSSSRRSAPAPPAPSRPAVQTRLTTSFYPRHPEVAWGAPRLGTWRPWPRWSKHTTSHGPSQHGWALDYRIRATTARSSTPRSAAGTRRTPLPSGQRMPKRSRRSRTVASGPRSSTPSWWSPRRRVARCLSRSGRPGRAGQSAPPGQLRRAPAQAITQALPPVARENGLIGGGGY